MPQENYPYASYSQKWKAVTAYLANAVVLAPTGEVIKRIADGTSRAAYDATEVALWTAVSCSDASTTVKASSSSPSPRRPRPARTRPCSHPSRREGRCAPAHDPGQRVFDVQEYGAIPNSPGTEFGTAWDAARTALVAAGGGWIWLSRDATGNAHFTARALVTTDSNRCQLPLPKNADNGNKFFVGITGDLATTTPFNYSGRNTPQTNGAIIESTATAETYNNVSIASVLGGPSVALTGTGYEFGFTDIQMMIRNVRVRLPANPSVAAVDFTYVNQADVDLICDTTEILNKTVFTQPTNRQAVGYAAPHTNKNAINKVRRLIVSRYYAAFLPGEHLDADEVILLSNYIGIGHVSNRDTSGHPNRSAPRASNSARTESQDTLTTTASTECGAGPTCCPSRRCRSRTSDPRATGADRSRTSWTPTPTLDGPGLLGRINATLSLSGYGRIVNGLKVKLSPSSGLQYFSLTDMSMMASGVDTIGAFSQLRQTDPQYPRRRHLGVPGPPLEVQPGGSLTTRPGSDLAPPATRCSDGWRANPQAHRDRNHHSRQHWLLPRHRRHGHRHQQLVRRHLPQRGHRLQPLHRRDRHHHRRNRHRRHRPCHARPHGKGPSRHHLRLQRRCPSGSYTMTAAEYSLSQSAARLGYYAGPGDPGDSLIGPLTVTIP